MTTKTKVIVTFETEGLHRWEGAPKETNFLKYPHRHVFKWRVECLVSHLNRQIEFFEVRAAARESADNIFTMEKITEKSCEMAAFEVLRDLTGPRNPHYTWAVQAVECWEDGENGARVEVSND